MCIQVIADMHIELAMKLADVLKQIWAEADRWNNDEKHAIAALSEPVDGALDCLDKLSVTVTVHFHFFFFS